MRRVKVKDRFKLFTEDARSIGLAILEVKELDLDEGIAYVVAHSLYECKPFKGQLTSTNSQYFRGTTTGIIGTLMKRENLVFIEEECIAKNDPYCSFKLEEAYGTHGVFATFSSPLGLWLLLGCVCI